MLIGGAARNMARGEYEWEFAFSRTEPRIPNGRERVQQAGSRRLG